MDIDTLIRDAARKLCQQYQLPAHIVEEDLLAELKPLLQLQEPDAEIQFPKDLDVGISLERDFGGLSTMRLFTAGTQEYTELKPMMTIVDQLPYKGIALTYKFKLTRKD